MPLRELDPPTIRPLGKCNDRPPVCACGVVITAQSNSLPKRAGQLAGLVTNGLSTSGPASMTWTEWPWSSSLRTITLPDEPAPTTT